MAMENSMGRSDCNAIRKNPYELKFFRQLHAEVEKVSSFFAGAKAELKIRCNRIKVGTEILKHSASKSNQRKWNLIEQSIYNLHSNLLLLEKFAIMNYCAFSKIMKKHDKKTGYKTRESFMTRVVNTSDFANYPDVLAMIRQCETLYGEELERLVCKEIRNKHEDEQPKIHMVRRIETKKLDTKGGCTFTNEGTSPKRKLAVLRAEIKPIIARASNKMEASMQTTVEYRRNLKGTKDPLSEISVDSFVIGRTAQAREDNNAADVSDYGDLKLLRSVSDPNPLKKQRCV